MFTEHKIRLVKGSDLVSYIQAGQSLVNLIRSFIPKKVESNPPPSPPDTKEDYEQLKQELNALGALRSQKETNFSGGLTITTQTEEKAPETRSSVATQCRLCQEDHLAGAAGSLKEALRFARTEGINSPEVLKRLAKVKEELVTMERYDYAPEEIQKVTPAEREVIRKYLPQTRELRHDVGLISSVQDLEKTAAKAGEISLGFFTEARKTVPEYMLQLVELTREVKEGKISLDEAQQRATKLGEAVAINEQSSSSPMSLDEAKKLAAETAMKEVERQWQSRGKK